MAVLDTIEGFLEPGLWYHYDVGSDVLYLRTDADRQTPTVSEETPEGYFLVRRESDDEVVGLTIVSWWRMSGGGALPDSISEFHERLEPWGKRLAA